MVQGGLLTIPKLTVLFYDILPLAVLSNWIANLVDQQILPFFVPRKVLSSLNIWMGCSLNLKYKKQKAKKNKK